MDAPPDSRLAPRSFELGHPLRSTLITSASSLLPDDPPPSCPSVLSPFVFRTADSSSVANTLSAQGAGEVDAEATTEADSGRPGRDRSAAERRLGRAGDRAGAWPLAQRDQYGDRARPGTGRQLRRRPSAGRSGSAARPVGTPDQAGAGQPAVCRGGEAPAPTVVAGADRRETQAHGGWNGGVIRTTSVARGDLPGDLRRAAR